MSTGTKFAIFFLFLSLACAILAIHISDDVSSTSTTFTPVIDIAGCVTYEFKAVTPTATDKPAENKEKFTSRCSVCIPGYYLNSKKVCEPCADNCMTCTSQTDCQSCSDGYFKLERSRGHKVPDIKVDTSSTELIKNHCVQCPSNCYQCTDLYQIAQEKVIDPASKVTIPTDYASLVQVKHSAELLANDNEAMFTKEGATKNYLKCIQCATSSYLNVFLNECIGCGNFCQNCDFVSTGNNSKCSKCELDHKLTETTKKCIDPTIEIVGSTFIRMLLALLFTSAFVAICCPAIFDKVSSKIQNNQIESLPIYKQIKGNETLE